jgi:hypothetical protein
MKALPPKRPHPIQVVKSLQHQMSGSYHSFGCVMSGRRQPWIETSSGMMRIATMLAILIIGLIAGPAVSL